MVSRTSAASREVLSELLVIEREHRALRTELRKIGRGEADLYRRLERLLSAGKPSHITLVQHRPGKKDRVTRHALDGARTLTALAQSKGSSGLGCGCGLVRVQRQPDGSVDVCVLYSCSNEPDELGVRCSYWCFNFAQEPVVAIARKRLTR